MIYDFIGFIEIQESLIGNNKLRARQFCSIHTALSRRSTYKADRRKVQLSFYARSLISVCIYTEVSASNNCYNTQNSVINIDLFIIFIIAKHVDG